MFHELEIDFSLSCLLLRNNHHMEKPEEKCMLFTTYTSFKQNFSFEIILGDLKIFY